MQNPIVESELQDICHFRKTILDSFQNIQNQLFKVKTPVKLTQNCNCTNENLPLNPFSACSFQNQTTNYFSDKKDLWTNHDNYKKRDVSKGDMISKYLNEYDLNSFNFDLEPLKQRKNVNLQKNNYFSQTPLKNKISDNLLKYTFQNTKKIPFVKNIHVEEKNKNEKNKIQIQKQNRNFYEKIKKQNHSQIESTSQIRSKSTQIDKYLTPRSDIKLEKPATKPNQFLIENSNRSNLMYSNVTQSTKGFQNQYFSVTKPKKKLVPKKKLSIEQLIHQQIKKRIQQSSKAQKNIGDTFQMVYQKQLRERKQVINIILNNPKVLVKYKKIIGSNI